MSKSIGLLFLAACVLAATRAADWPQWRGPHRDGISRETNLLPQWPEDGPDELWSADGLGQGYATVAVSGDLVYTTGIADGQGHLFVFRADGTPVSKTAYGKDSVQGKGYPGARSTPTVVAGRIFVMTGFGVVNCFDQKTLRRLWQVDTFERFGGRQINWEIAESLLVHGDLVICTPGGADALLAALNVADGRTVWTTKGLDSKSAYCSPVVVKHGGREMILTMVEYGAVGVDARSGELLWSHAHKNRYAVHAATPIYHDGWVFISSGYGHGSEMLEIAADGKSVRQVWAAKALDNHHGGVILMGGRLYGTNDRGLVCLDWKTGEVVWTERGVGKGSLTAAGGMLYAYGERNGMVGLIKPEANGARVISSFVIKKGSAQHWAHPVVANGRLYIRHGEIGRAHV